MNSIVFVYYMNSSVSVFYELSGVDTMAPKEAKKRMKASEDKKRKLLQISSGPTPRKTVSHRAPSIGLKCQMQIVIFLGNNNRFYISTKSNLNHSHHPSLKSEAILRGQSDLVSSEIDLLTLLSDVNVTSLQIAQIMETLRGPQGGTFMPKRVYDMNQKTEELHDFATGLLPDSNDVQKTIAKLEQKQINHFYILHEDSGLYACSKGRPNKETVRTRLECPEKIMTELEELRDDFILNEKSQMLVMVSMATDEMIRLVAMYPDVWFMDTTAGKSYYMNSCIP